jgi:hypothetical protein
MSSVLDTILQELRALRKDVDMIKQVLLPDMTGGGEHQKGDDDVVAGNQVLSTNADFFKGIVDIYKQEQARKKAVGNRWASGRLVARNIAEYLTAYLRHHLKTLFPDIEVSTESAPGRDPVYVVVRRRGEEGPRAVVRWWTDLGYRRGKHWFTELQPLVHKECSHLGAKPGQVLLLVGTMVNSLDNAYVKTELRALGLEAPPVTELCQPENRSLLEAFLKRYVGSIDPNVIPDPQTQVFFLASNLHPNDPNMWDANAPYLSPSYQGWLSPSLPDLLKKLDQLCR